MGLFVIVILFVFTIATYWSTQAETQLEDVTNRAATRSHLMVSYHAAALRACGSSCVDGVQPVAPILAQMPTAYASTSGSVSGSGFLSFVVSTTDPASGLPVRVLATAFQSPSAREQGQEEAAVMTDLYKRLSQDTRASVGAFRRPDTVRTRSVITNTTTGTNTPVTYVVGDAGGRVTHGGAPTLVTRVP